MTITLRSTKGSALTHNELDGNFTDLNTNKAPLASPTFTGTPAAPTAVADTNTTQIATTAHVFAERTNTATLTNKTLTAPVINSPTGIVKGDVGLGNVDNTSDATKNSATATLTNKTIDTLNNTITVVAADVSDFDTEVDANIAAAVGVSVMAHAPAVSQAEAEAGTEVALRAWSPLRVAQAIAALETGAGGGDITTDPAWTAAGDLIVATGDNAAAVLAKGADGTFLGVSGGTVGYYTPAGSGDVVKVGTPVNNQVGVWTGDGTIEGDAALSFDTTTDLLTIGAGSLTRSGTHALTLTTTATTNVTLPTTGTLSTLAGSESLSNKTVVAPTLSGVVTRDGAEITTANAMAALEVDVTKGFNTKTISTDSTFTFSAAASVANRWFSVLITNSDTVVHRVTLPSCFNMTTGTTAAHVIVIPGSGRVMLAFRDTGTAYEMHGDQGYLDKLDATSAPTVNDDIADGYGPGSFWLDATNNNFYVCESSGAGAAVWHNTTTGQDDVPEIIAGTTLTLDALDNGKQFIFTNAANITVTVGTSADGVSCDFLWLAGAGTISVVPSSTTINGGSATIVLSQAAGGASLVYTGTANTWYLTGSIGDLIATDITDSTTVGRNLLTAADESSARTAALAAARSQTESEFSFLILTPEDGDYTIRLKASHAGTITEVATQSSAGTSTLTMKIDGVALGGTANSVSTTETAQTHSTSNSFSAGNTISITLASTSVDCTKLACTAKYTRTLQ